MTTSDESTTGLTESGTLVITRTFPSPREGVWNAWTQKEQAVRWWGPKAFSTVEFDADVRTGGAWRAVLRSPGGEDCPQGGEFRELTAPQRLVFSLVVDESGDAPSEMLVMVNLSTIGPTTEMTFRKGPFASEEAQRIAEESWNAAFDRLEEVLAPTSRQTT